MATIGFCFHISFYILNNDRTDDARRVLESQKEFTPEMLNTLAASYVFTYIAV